MFVFYTLEGRSYVATMADWVTEDTITQALGFEPDSWRVITAYEADVRKIERSCLRKIHITEDEVAPIVRRLAMGAASADDVEQLQKAEVKVAKYQKEIKDILAELEEAEGPISGAPEPAPEGTEQLKARLFSEKLLTARLQRQMVQTEDFAASDFSMFAVAGLFDAWQPDTLYKENQRLVYEETVYQTVLEHTSQAHQQPGSEGMLAVYRPISANSETGEESDGSLENPHAYRYGMDVYNGSYYTFGGRTYLAKADMFPCIWEPGTEGIWQWEPV